MWTWDFTRNHIVFLCAFSSWSQVFLASLVSWRHRKVAAMAKFTSRHTKQTTFIRNMMWWRTPRSVSCCSWALFSESCTHPWGFGEWMGMACFPDLHAATLNRSEVPPRSLRTQDHGLSTFAAFATQNNYLLKGLEGGISIFKSHQYDTDLAESQNIFKIIQIQPNLPLDQNQSESYFFHSHDHNHDTYIEYGWIWISTLVKTCPTIRMSETGLVSGWLWSRPLGRSLWRRPSSLGSLSSDQKLPKSWDFQLDFGEPPPHL